MPIPSQNFNTPQELIAYINSLIIPNGMKLISGEKDNNAMNGLLNLTLKSINNYGTGARIISTGGDVTLNSVFNVITGEPPATLKWANVLSNEYYVINTTASAVPLAEGFSYYDAFSGTITAIPPNSSIHIAKAISGLWIQFYNPTGDVVIQNPIVITTQPQSQTITQGQNATFTIVASGGIGTLSYQARKNGTPISGATTSTYTITGAQTIDAGSYDFLITDSLGNIRISNTATLTVNAIGLQNVYVGRKAENDLGNPTEFEIVTGLLSSQNAVGDVIADWTSFRSDPAVLWVAIQAVSTAAQKNKWIDNSNTLNSAMFASDGLFSPMVIVSVGGVDYYVTSSNYLTQVASDGATYILTKV